MGVGIPKGVEKGHFKTCYILTVNLIEFSFRKIMHVLLTHWISELVWVFENMSGWHFPIDMVKGGWQEEALFDSLTKETSVDLTRETIWGSKWTSIQLKNQIKSLELSIRCSTLEEQILDHSTVVMWSSLENQGFLRQHHFPQCLGDVFIRN